MQRLVDRTWQALERSGLIERGTAFYRRHQDYAPIAFFFGGVAWDMLTLQRIDAWVDNLILMTYLTVLGWLIVVAAQVEHKGTAVRPWMQRYAKWYPAAIQFFLGALFSAYVVFYFQSASLTETSLFLVLLVVLLVANEFIHRRLVNLYLLFALYFLAAVSFFIFFLPVLFKTMGYPMFVAGGVLGFLVTAGLLTYLRRREVFEQQRQYWLALVLVAALFGVLHLFYVRNWIPPVPLAMRHGDVYHLVQKRGGVYELWLEEPAWYEFWITSDDVFHYTPGEAIYCFTAIFAPTKLTRDIFHEWRYYNEARGVWETTDRIGYEVVGGRDNGYRGFTLKRHIQPGRWQVEVQTGAGRILGRIRFTVEPAEAPLQDLKRIVYE